MTGNRHQLETDSERSALMSRVRQHGTRAEDDVASTLRELGVRYRRNVRALPGSPDFANRSRRWAVFVHGCFWHNHPGCARATIPTRNRNFWLQKFATNRTRDQIKARELAAMGFRVIVIWECESNNRPLALRRLRPLEVN
jgi:DNA mismatch endonuclease, patch repair protein